MKKLKIPQQQRREDDSSPPRRVSIGRIAYTAFLCVMMAMMFCQPAFPATHFWSKATDTPQTCSRRPLTNTHLHAVCTSSVALLLMNFSRSGRTVDESRAWLKRICITWAVLNGLGFIMAYVTPLFSGGQWTG